MATTQLMLPGQIVKKDNRLVRAKINISSVDASRILANLVACISVEDKDLTQVYRVALKDFFRDTSGRGYTRAKSLCRDLAQATAELEQPAPDGSHIFKIGPFFSVIRYENGTVEAKFNQEMSHLLLNLKQCFTQYNLIEYLRLPSIYSQRMFEILKSWSGNPEVVISVRELHKMLNTPPSFQSNFKEFRRWVLERAHKDITKNTSFTYEWEPVKVGRSVERIRFLFAGNRRAIAEKVKEDARREKQSRLNNSRFLRAVQCAQAKHGNCTTPDNRPIICKMCRRFDMCASAQEKN